MRSLVISTKAYDEEAKEYNCTRVFARFKSEVEKTPCFQVNKRFIFGFGDYFKKPHTNFRSIFTFKHFDINNEDVCCYIALRVLKRGDAEYKRFIQSKLSSSERDKISGLCYIDWDAVKAQLQEELAGMQQDSILPDLSGEELEYIQNTNTITHKILDIPIYESKYWVDAISQDSFNLFTAVSTKIKDYVENSFLNDQYGLFELTFSEKDIRVLGIRFKEKEKDGYFLLGLGTLDEVNKIKQEVFPNGVDNIQINDLISQCRRAYPFSMLETQDFWREMEKDKDSNFILSDEEMDVVSNPRLAFPLFLSGRAGSGKSTVLQYLFSEFLLRYCISKKIQPPVYLSYSHNLIDQAKKLAKNLFTNNHVYEKKLSEVGKDFEKDIKPAFDNVFFTFHDILKGCINSRNNDVLSSRFSADKYVSYAKFRYFWEQKFSKEANARKKFGPALSWHVIRTYIKGWDSESYFELNDYKELGKNSKSVSDDVFDLVLKKVWSWYSQKQSDEGLWDDQDLVRYCLAPDDDSCDTYVTDMFSAIFCDEAQDFTRIETEFILRLSIFSHRRIYNENLLYNIPFVFAGDEFQTLNPTGFSWDSLRSYFTESLIRNTGLPNSLGAPKPLSLTKNYRSATPIVKLANRLQLLREATFGNDSPTKPQTPYYSEDKADSVYCLSPSDRLVWDKLCQMGAILIIPSADGQSPKDFLSTTPISGMIEFDKKGISKNITILNPIQAKGLEYANVALYGFDNPELRIDKLEKFFDLSASSENDAKAIELKYFLSNAYVSITRAKSKLFIISDFTDDSFWAFAFSPNDLALKEKIADLQGMMLAKVKNPEEWESLLGYIVKGEADAITDESILDPGERAKVVENQAMSLRDAMTMRQAAARYRESGDFNGATRCEGYAYEFEYEYFSAGNSFVSAKMYKEAVSAYWHACPDKSIRDVLSTVAKLAGKYDCFEINVAQSLSKIVLSDLKMYLYKLLSILKKQGNDPEKQVVLETKETWRRAFILLIEQLPKASPDQNNDISIIVQCLRELDYYGIRIKHQKLPMLAFEADSLDIAIDLWEDIGVSEYPPEYHQAKCSVLSYPENIAHRSLSGDPYWQEKVVEDYRMDNGEHKIDRPDLRQILEMALFSVGSREETLNSFAYLLSCAEDINEARKLIKLAQKRDILFPKECLDAIFLMRYGGLDKWNVHGVFYQSDVLNQLMRTIIKVKYVRSKKFLEKLNDALGVKKYRVDSVLSEEFGDYARMTWSPILFTEIGAVMEKRGYFIDSVRYYEWAQRRTDDPELKRDLQIRWIVCKERQAVTSDNSDDILHECNVKRAELKLPHGANFPASPEFSRWNWLFNEILKIDPSKREKHSKGSDRKLSPVMEENISLPENKSPQENDDGIPLMEKLAPQNEYPMSDIQEFEQLPLNSTQSDDKEQSKFSDQTSEQVSTDEEPLLIKIPAYTPSRIFQSEYDKTSIDFSSLPDKKFIYEIAGYKIKYNPFRSELAIDYETSEEDLHIKIKKGKIPSDADFEIFEGRLLQSTTRQETPFKIDITPRAIRITHIDSSAVLIFQISDK